MAIKGSGLEVEDFLGSLIDTINNELGHSNAANNIVDFLNKEIDREAWGVKEIHRRQWLVLKTFYGLELEPEDIEILEAWYALDRTSINPEFYKVGVQAQSLCIEAGRRGSKSFSASIIVAYEFYRLCMMKSPQKHYGIASSTPIAIYCIATSATQTKRTIFGQAKALLDYIPSIKRLIDQKKIIVGEEEVKYPDKMLHIYSGNSNSASQVGSSVILLAMDEVARFDEEGYEEGESNALKLWSNIGISGVTFGADAKRVAISSAWCEGDAIQVLYNKSKTSAGRVGFRLRSWDLNPVHAARDNPIIQAEYDDDPRAAALEFEGVRYNKTYSFFNDIEVERAFTGNSVLRATVMPPAEDNLVRLAITDIRPYRQATVMHLDPAFVKDAYAIAFGHREQRKDQKIVVIDALLAWEPDIGQQVGISNVYQTIYQIHHSRPLSKITSDHYNPETIQRLKGTGLNASIMTFSAGKQLEIYDFTRKLLHEDRLIFPKDSQWSSKLKEELFGIQLIKGRKIDHRRDGCFVGETRIPLLDGTRPTIAELEGKEVWVYSCKPDGTIVPGKARGRKTKDVLELLDVVLDTGAIIRCTPEHPFMTRNGEYIQAKDISAGITRLMPVNFLWSINGGYEKVSGIKKEVATHWMALGLDTPGEGNVVHHLNGIKTDNRVRDIIPVNLENPVAVYDLEVDKWDNFALAAGVFVHNSKDLADCICAVAWHLMSDQTASLSFDTNLERTVRRSNPNDEFADLGFQSAGRPLAGQIRRGYSGWGTRDNSSGSWSYDEY